MLICGVSGAWIPSTLSRDMRGAVVDCADLDVIGLHPFSYFVLFRTRIAYVTIQANMLNVGIIY